MHQHQKYYFNYKPHTKTILKILWEVYNTENFDWKTFRSILNKHPREGVGIFSKSKLYNGLEGFRKEIKEDEFNLDLLSEITGSIQVDWLFSEKIQQRLQMKPTRTQSGVTPVTVLTKPFPCPGQCIFCPNDTRMPKSYMSDEPGCQRAERNGFDPYLQTFSRMKALQSIGHEVDKVELIILGGTWSFYPEAYQIWFVQRCFQAINDFGENLEEEYFELLEKIGDPDYRSRPKNHEVIRNAGGAGKPTPFQGKASQSYNQIISAKLKLEKDSEYTKSQRKTWDELFSEHKRNETAKYKVSGLVIETRPDNISEKEVIRVRKLGCTKTQIGFQSLNDEVLEKNHRGHDVAATRRAIYLLRQAGFKIHGHWMANLYGSSPQKDIQDYHKMFADPDFCPDELKIYPCSLIDTAELMDYHEAGLWEPYNDEDLSDVLISVLQNTPQYCRLTRVIRDIPSQDIVVGNKKTNFRQIAELKAEKMGIKPQEIRSREVRKDKVKAEDLFLDEVIYESSFGKEYFLQFVTSENRIAGFLRLAIPKYFVEWSDSNSDGVALVSATKHPFIPELSNATIIREIHVYGQVVAVGDKEDGKAQHLGLGKKLIQRAEEISKSFGAKKIAVISSVGTREYYRKRGFEDGELYQVKLINN